MAIYSPNGGAGVSTTAVNLAVRLARAAPGRVALVDLKPAPSDLSLLLDLEPQHTLDEVCRQAGRLDRKLLAGAMARHASGVDVLAQAGYPADGGQPEKALNRDAVKRLTAVLRRAYAVSVFDLDHRLDEEQVEAMRQSSFVGLVVRADVPGLRRARWALDTAVRLGVPHDRFRLVLNRAGQRGQIGSPQIEHTLGIPIFQAIPEAHPIVNRAVNRGVPLVALSQTARISRSFSALARSVQTSAGSTTA